MADAIPVHPLVLAFAQSFVLRGDRLLMSQEDIARHCLAFAAAPAAERETMSVHMVALAQRIVREARGAADRVDLAVALIIAVTVDLLAPKSAAVADMFRDAGLGKAHADVIGASAATRQPAAAAPPSPPPVRAKRGLQRAPRG